MHSNNQEQTVRCIAGNLVLGQDTEFLCLLVGNTHQSAEGYSPVFNWPLVVLRQEGARIFIQLLGFDLSKQANHGTFAKILALNRKGVSSTRLSTSYKNPSFDD